LVIGQIGNLKNLKILIYFVVPCWNLSSRYGDLGGGEEGRDLHMNCIGFFVVTKCVAPTKGVENKRKKNYYLGCRSMIIDNL
jgi:hypothetical protein